MGKNKVMKNIFSESSIARKLWVWFLIVAAVPLMIVGLLTNYNSIETIKTEVSSRLNSVAENKTELINNYFKWRLEDVKILSENLSIIEASEKFTGVFEKHGLKSSEYKVIDKEFRRFLTYHKEGRGYSDILFISKAGDVVFTLMHKPDFGTNLITGPYKDSELANVFSNAYTLMETEVSDFKYYPPSAEPVSFIASPVRKEGKLIAVIAFQIDTREMNKLAQDFTGLGETGEIVISSKTKNGAIVLTPLRNDLYTAFKRIIPIGSVRGIPSQKAVQGQRGSGIFEDYRGVEVLAVWRYLPYLRWGVVVKIDVSEAYTPIYKLTIRFLTVGIISVFVLLFVSFFLSKSISKPIKRLQEGVEIISTGNLNYVVGITTKDEIGQLSRSFDKMVVNLKNINADLTKEITERKKAEEDLRESEGRVRAKLDAILLPEGDIGTLELADIFDIPAIQRLMNDFFTVTHFATALLDLQGKVLVATGWQDICTKFHRVHPETAKHCAESDTLLTEGVEPGTFKKYRCKNNMLDIVTPITMDGKHVGNLFLGQFLFEDEPLDYELFRDQARRYGFDEQEYIAAYERVSRWSREKVDAVMSFYMKLAELISKLSHGNIKLVRTLTERDRFMGSLRENEKRYRNLVENAPDIIYSLAEDGSIISLNPAFERITGWSCSEWLGKPFMTLIHPSDLPLAIESFKQSLGGKNQPPYELRVLSKSGEYLVGEFTSTPLIEKDKVIGEFGIARDITERKRAEEALHLSQITYQGIFDGVTEAIYLQDEEGNFLDVNRAAELMYGYPREYFIGKTPEFLSAPGKNNLALILEAVRKAFAGEPQYFEFWGLHKDGIIFPKDVRLSPGTYFGKKVVIAVARDITERKKIEEQLVRLSDAVRMSTDSIVVSDLEARIVDVNEATLKMFGTDDRRDLVGKSSLELIAPEDREKALEGMREVLEKGYVKGREYHVTTKGGGKILVEMNVSVMQDVDGKPAGFVGVSRDITERKRAELERQAMFEIIQGVTITDNLNELLQSIHQALKKVLYAENCFIALYNHNTGLFSFPYFVDQFDTAPAPQALEKSCTSYVFRTGCPMSITEELFQQLKEQGEVELVGTPSPSWLGVPLRTPSETIGVLVVQHYDDEYAYTKRDVEFFASVGSQIALAIERKRAEEEIRKLSRAVEQSPASVVITNPAGDIVYVNEKFCLVTGYSREEAIGNNPRILKSGHHDKNFYEELWNTILSGKDWGCEMLNKKKNGEFYWESVLISPVVNNEGDITHFIAIREDITEKKKMIKDIIIAKELAEEANRLKSGFLSAMSHEIRTPINTIIGFNSVIRDIFEDAANGEQKMFFDAIENGSLRLLNTITQILDISRIEANEFNIELISMSINKVIESVYRQVKILADKKKLGINLLLPETDVKVIADDYCLNGVLMNILSNAIKYSKKGTIEVKLEEEKDHAVCTIKDEGIGMSEGYQKHLYQSFSQEDVGFSRRYEGTGLGLALIKKYIDLMNGAIDVESKKGVGTTVTIIIPLDK